MQKIKSCPFCGGEAIIKKTRSHAWIIGCDGRYGNACHGYLWKCAPVYLTKESVITAWNRRTNETEHDIQIWHDGSERPPREGRYIVWGLTEFVPDHNGQPNAFWETRIGVWSNKTGWNVKVKFWRNLLDPPEQH